MRPRRIAAILALFCMLFTQLALASYICPAEGRTDSSAQIAMSPLDEPMENCTGMDMDQPTLCHAYDHKTDQSLDKPGTPSIAPFVPVFLVATLSPPYLIPLPTPPHTEAPLLARSTAPPLSIRHCCFRI